MILRDITIGADIEILYDHYHEVYPKFHQKFQEHLHCISDHLLARIWKQVRDIPITKIFMTFYITEEQYKLRYDEWDHVLTFNSTFDFDKYLTLSEDVEKKRMIANRIYDEFQILFSERKWNFVPIHTAFQEMESRQFQFDGIVKPSWVNPSKKFRAKIYFSHELEEIRLEALLYKNGSKKEICRRYMTSLVPSGWNLAPYLDNVHWLSETILESYTANFAKKVVRVDFSEAMFANPIVSRKVRRKQKMM